MVALFSEKTFGFENYRYKESGLCGIHNNAFLLQQYICYPVIIIKGFQSLFKVINIDQILFSSYYPFIVRRTLYLKYVDLNNLGYIDVFFSFIFHLQADTRNMM